MESLNELRPHRWITPKAEPFNSKVHGIGVRAIENIKAGEIVAIFGGVVIPTKEIKKYWDEVGHIGIQIDDDYFIVPPNRKEADEIGVFNHSCVPNCGFKDRVTLIAIKDIGIGEELVFDYAFCESFMGDFKCECNESNCRKVIRQTDWKNQYIQDKYARYYSPYLKSKISKS